MAEQDRVGAVLMSATTFAGSAQFAAASILDDGGGALAATVAAILLNARYVPFSLAVASIFPGSRQRRFLESQLIVDESCALSGRAGRFDYAILAGVGILLYVLWVGGTAIGTVVGDPAHARVDREQAERRAEEQGREREWEPDANAVPSARATHRADATGRGSGGGGRAAPPPPWGLF
jgi:hypothetical protein